VADSTTPLKKENGARLRTPSAIVDTHAIGRGAMHRIINE
jgi:hypothetical protein